MILLRALLVGLLLQNAAMAQQYGSNNSRRHGVAGSRNAVATQPSSNPFVNPIGQGVPPAVSSQPYLNSNRTNVPLGRTN